MNFTKAAVAVALGAVGLAGIVAAFGSVDDLLVHSRSALELLPLMGPAMIGMIFGKNIVGLLIGR